MADRNKNEFIDSQLTRYADIRRDKVFKLVFAEDEGSRPLLVKFMNCMLPDVKVHEVTLVNKEMHGETIDEEKKRMEEMGLRGPVVIPYNLDAVHVVSIINGTLMHDQKTVLEDGLISRYALREQTSGEIMTRALDFTIMELGRMNFGPTHPEKCITLVQKVAFVLKYITYFNEQPESLKGDLLDDLFGAVEMASWSFERKNKYVNIMMTENDYARYTAEQVAKGREEARKEVREEERRAIAKALLSKDISPEVVSESTGLSIEELKAL